jgi:hypothetical protein
MSLLSFCVVSGKTAREIARVWQFSYLPIRPHGYKFVNV